MSDGRRDGSVRGEGRSSAHGGGSFGSSPYEARSGAAGGRRIPGRGDEGDVDAAVRHTPDAAR